MSVMSGTPESQLLRKVTELQGCSVWEKGSENTIIANLHDSHKPPYSPTTAKWDVEQLMHLTEVQLRAVKEMVGRYVGVFSTGEFDLGCTKRVGLTQGTPGLSNKR